MRWLAGPGGKTQTLDSAKKHRQERERSLKAEWKNRLGRRTQVYELVTWTSPVSPRWCAVCCYSLKEQWIQGLEASLPILVPPVPTGVILEKSCNPSLPHFLKTGMFSKDCLTPSPLAVPLATGYSSRGGRDAPSSYRGKSGGTRSCPLPSDRASGLSL